MLTGLVGGIGLAFFPQIVNLLSGTTITNSQGFISRIFRKSDVSKTGNGICTVIKSGPCAPSQITVQIDDSGYF